MSGEYSDSERIAAKIFCLIMIIIFAAGSVINIGQLNQKQLTMDNYKNYLEIDYDSKTNNDNFNNFMRGFSIYININSKRNISNLYIEIEFPLDNVTQTKIISNETIYRGQEFTYIIVEDIKYFDFSRIKILDIKGDLG